MSLIWQHKLREEGGESLEETIPTMRSRPGPEKSAGRPLPCWTADRSQLIKFILAPLNAAYQIHRSKNVPSKANAHRARDIKLESVSDVKANARISTATTYQRSGPDGTCRESPSLSHIEDRDAGTTDGERLAVEGYVSGRPEMGVSGGGWESHNPHVSHTKARHRAPVIRFGGLMSGKPGYYFVPSPP
jgi:hypothetical protein